MNLQESYKNITKDRNILAKIVLSIVYLAIWGNSLIVFWYFTDNSDAMGYSLVFLWFLIPCTTFVSSIIIGKNNYWGKHKWVCAVVFGMMYMLIEFTTFSIANMIRFDKVNLPRFEMIFSGGIISLIGMGIGVVIRRKLNKASGLAKNNK